MPFKPLLLRATLLCLLTLLAQQTVVAQTLDLDNSAGFKSSPLPDATQSATLQAFEFLPVEEAYRLSAEVVSAGQLRLLWAIADGYYLYQKQLKFSIDGQSLSVDLPRGQSKYDDYFEEHLVVYYHELQIDLNLPTATSSSPLVIKVGSQGCADAGLCYPPQTQYIRVSGNTTELLSTPATGQSPATRLSPPNKQGAIWPLLAAVFGALAGGAMLNLMPCVFPVLSLKALSLANAHLEPHRQHLHGWAYTAGAITLFVAIAALMLVLRQAGYAIGWGFQLQSPVVVGALAYLFFTMGLCLSGNFNPGAGWSGIGQSLTGGHSLTSSFFTGALACVVASPCTAPFMGTALGFAVTMPAPLALAVFAALGLGMALPFLLLSYYPSLTRIMPRPGAWMETFKQFLAYPLYLTALWLLWVLGRQSGSDAVILLCSGAVAIAMALWLLNMASNSWPLRLAAIACLALAAIPLTRVESTNGVIRASEEGWQPYSEARLSQLQQLGSPVFVNLTADWCITCLANEKAVLSSEAVLSAFDRAGVVRLKGDWTNYNPQITDLLTRFGRNGVPLYLLYSGREGEAPSILPQILSKKTVLSAISRKITDK